MSRLKKMSKLKKQFELIKELLNYPVEYTKDTEFQGLAHIFEDLEVGVATGVPNKKKEDILIRKEAGKIKQEELLTLAEHYQNKLFEAENLLSELLPLHKRIFAGKKIKKFLKEQNGSSLHLYDTFLNRILKTGEEK